MHKQFLETARNTDNSEPENSTLNITGQCPNYLLKKYIIAYCTQK